MQSVVQFVPEMKMNYKGQAGQNTLNSSEFQKIDFSLVEILEQTAFALLIIASWHFSYTTLTYMDIATVLYKISM